MHFDAEHRRTVLVVDDSAFMRKVVAELVDGCAGFRVVGTARDGRHALDQIRALDPDIVTLDVEMPEMDGLAALGTIMRDAPRAVVMLSASGSANASALTIRALELGAVDFVQKPSGPISLDLATVRERLHEALRAASCVNLDGVRPTRPLPPLPVRVAMRARVPATRVVVVATSTGGPSALAGLLSALPRDLDAAVLVVQHMPRGFTATLANRLDSLSALDVREAVHGEPVTHGRAYVAPGGLHMRVERDGGDVRIALDDGPSVWGVRPSADPLFRAAVEAFGSQVVGAVLTGMGRDGAEGLRLVRRAGGRGVVQDRATSVVYGMPREALEVAGADVVAPLPEVPAAILALLAALPRVDVRPASAPAAAVLA